MIQIVLCGHGHYGTSTLESIHMLAGNVDSYSAVDFTKEMDMNYKQRLKNYYMHSRMKRFCLFAILQMALHLKSVVWKQQCIQMYMYSLVLI